MPALELANEGPTPTPSSWAEFGGRIIDNIPNAFADGALGGVEAEPLVMGPPGRWVPRVTARYLTEGVGHDDAFTFLSGAIPYSFREKSEHSLNFVELTGGVSSHSELTGSVEFVDRDYKDGKKRVHGDYLAFDYRDSLIGDYRQIAFGDDWLGVAREARYNIYIPLGRNRKTISTTQTVVPVGTSLVPAVVRENETALYGGDVEYGWRVFPMDKASIWFLLGAYHFQAGGVSQVWGVKARTEFRLWDLARLSVEFQRDDVFGSNFVFGGEVVFPGTRPRGRPDDCYLTDRLGESVRRWRTITLARSTSVDFL